MWDYLPALLTIGFIYSIYILVVSIQFLFLFLSFFIIFKLLQRKGTEWRCLKCFLRFLFVRNMHRVCNILSDANFILYIHRSNFKRIFLRNTIK